MRKISIFLVALAWAVFSGGVGWSSFLEKDFEGIDFTPGFMTVRSGERLSKSQAEALARELLGNLATIPGKSGRTLLPQGTRVDRVEIEDGQLRAFLTFPENLAEEAITPLTLASIGDLIQGELMDSAGIIASHVEGRLGALGAYRPLGAFIPERVVQPADDSGETAEGPPPPAQTQTTVIGPIGPAGTQPTGALTGKIVYCSGGHGWTWSSSSLNWYLQRPLLHEMVEDYGNIDQLNFFVNYCFNAGATVVPFRPVGWQDSEVVLDNDDPGVTFSGSWSNSSASVYYGDPGDLIPYRYASVSTTETATARYTPNLPEAGFYPVYCWTRDANDRVADQTYRILHSSGTAVIKLDHRKVGKGWIWLGTYYFNSGTGQSVEISNQSADTAPSRIVIADAIRWGCGMGDVDRGGGVSGYSRDTEQSRYWVQRGFGQGSDTGVYDPPYSDGSDNVGTPPRMAAHMNREVEGATTDRVYIGYHSNASSGTARGVVSLLNDPSYAGGRPDGQEEIAFLTAQEIRSDLIALNSNWNPDWYYRSSLLYSSSYGEINSNAIGNEMGATIIEVAFHDNEDDAKLLRDGRVRNMVARASYQAVVRYFNQEDGGATPLVFLPDPPTNFRVVNTGSGEVSLAWDAPVVDGIGGNAATGYKVYQSANGYGFDNGTAVPGTNTTASGLTAGSVYYFRVAAANAGGESLPSEVLAVRVREQGLAPILLVNGFDRFDYYMNPTDTIPNGPVDRVMPRRMNSFDYVIPYAKAIGAVDRDFDSCSNEAIIDGQVSLSGYEAVLWILGEEAVVDPSNNVTFDTTEQALVGAYLSGGGNLFLSGSEIGWDLDHLNNGRSFYENTLRTDYAGDDAGTYTVTGSGGIFVSLSSLSFSVAGGAPYDVDWPDQLTPLSGATANLIYVGGSGGTAGVQVDTGAYRVVNLGFPFECLTSETVRNDMIDAVLTYFSVYSNGACSWQMY